ncbi:ATP-dependent DNA helicase RecG [Patescibacteria group bacterium]|nr:ATP-dependent DNA helicase RecG [Patescibacteria group bacterium]
MPSRENLLHHYPFRYEDLSHSRRGKVVSCRNLYTRSGKTVQKARVETNAGVEELTWFNQTYLSRLLSPGTMISFFGQNYEIITGKTLIHTNRLVPIYPETKGVTSKMLRRRIYNLLKLPIKDWLPDSIKKKYGLIGLGQALQQIHFPKNLLDAKQAKQRLAFDEILCLQLEAQAKKAAWHQKKLSRRLVIDREKLLRLISNLPFKLTLSQNQVVKEILNNLESDQPMNRLLQGEVGSGKTVVAALAMYVTYLNGYQSILMAPTEILVEQHYQTLKSVFLGTPIKIGLVTKSVKDTGDILIGTQALLYKKLGQAGLLVIDEQHRFGVAQRSKLLQTHPTPHLLSMTATPIPRTLALTVYADLDVSLLTDLPFAKPVAKTWVVPETKRLKAYHWIASQIKKHQAQAFVVCPLIEPSEKESMKDIKAVTQEFKNLQQIFNQFKLEFLHGRLKTDQKNQILSRFTQGKTQMLVTTPVIEVGIDIPRATIMVVEAAERFGLAQLHQLRGRVGRRGQSSYCLLFSRQNSQRLRALESVSDGLRLAKLDLKQRGPGTAWGLAQHGWLKLKLADLSDLKLISAAKKAAADLKKLPGWHKIDPCHHSQNEKSLPGAGVNVVPALN